VWTFILQSLGWLLLEIYKIVKDYGIAIILFTLLIKVVLLPFAMKGRKGMMKMQMFTPKQKALEAKYKDDKERYNLELQKLYKQEKVNPLGGCLWTLLPWPIFIALYQVMRMPLTNMLRLTGDEIAKIAKIPEVLAAFGGDEAALATAVASNEIPLANALHSCFDKVVAALPELGSKLVNIDFDFFGLNLSLVPNVGVLNWYWLLPVLSAGFALLSTVVMQKMQGTQNDQASGNMKFMTYLGPIMSLVIGFTWPAAMSFYWTANSAISMAQDYLLTLYYRKKLNVPSPKEVQAEEDAKKAEEEAREQAREERRARLAEGGVSAPNRGNMSSKKYRQLKAQQEQKKIAAPADEIDNDADADERSENDD